MPLNSFARFINQARIETPVELVKYLMENPQAFPDRPERVRMVETHISWVFLTGRFAYKIKKPVDYGFLNFTTLAKRRFYCRQELLLNSRLSDIYLAVLPIRLHKQGFCNMVVGAGKGRVVEYAVQMTELPQDMIMKELLKQDRVTERQIKALAKLLSDFYSRAKGGRTIARFGKPTAIRRNTDENFSQTLPFVGQAISKEEFDFVKRGTDAFLSRRALFKSRESMIKDCHGDLHTGNIFISDRIHVFDCIEFNRRFRYSDIVSDLAFLVMDLEYTGKKGLAKLLVEEYKRLSRDTVIDELLLFYMCYRAYVRFKICCFQNLTGEARSYALLAVQYAARLHRLRPCLILLSGRSATGKSLWGKKLRDYFCSQLISSDALRKEMFGKDWKPAGFGKGIYEREKRDWVYEQMFGRAAEALKEGRAVTMDATFNRKELRDRARGLGRKAKVLVVLIETACNDSETLQRRLLKKRGDSHAGPEVHKSQAFEPIESDHLLIDTSAPVEENVSRLTMFLASEGLLVSKSI